MPTAFLPALRAHRRLDQTPDRRNDLAKPSTKEPVPQESLKNFIPHYGPPTYLFLGVQTEQKRTLYFCNWMRYSKVLHARISSNAVYHGFKSQTWRDLLGGCYKRNPKSVTTLTTPSSEPIPAPPILTSISASRLPPPPHLARSKLRLTEEDPMLTEINSTRTDNELDHDRVWITSMAEGIQLRAEEERDQAEPPGWCQTNLELWIQGVEDNVIQEFASGSIPAKARLTQRDEWDVWWDYDHCRVIHFNGYVDHEHKGRAVGERCLRNLFTWIALGDEPKPPSIRIWRALPDRHLSSNNKVQEAHTHQTEDSETPDLLFGFHDFDYSSPIEYEARIVSIDGQCGWDTVGRRRKILWHLSELNFRFEVLLLDNHLRKHHASVFEKHQSEPERDRQRRCVWGGEPYFPAWNTENALCSRDWKKRVKNVIAFHDLMLDWPRVPKELKVPISLQRFDDEAAFKQFEECVWEFYCQTYFDYFVKYSCLPCIMPNDE